MKILIKKSLTELGESQLFWIYDQQPPPFSRSLVHKHQRGRSPRNSIDCYDDDDDDDCNEGILLMIANKDKDIKIGFLVMVMKSPLCFYNRFL